MLLQHVLRKLGQGGGCSKAVHIWLALKAGEPSSYCTQQLSRSL